MIHNGMQIERIKSIDILNGVFEPGFGKNYNQLPDKFNDSKNSGRQQESQNELIGQQQRPQQPQNQEIFNSAPQQGQKVNIPFFETVQHSVQVLPKTQRYDPYQQQQPPPRNQVNIPIIGQQVRDQQQYKNPVYLHSSMGQFQQQDYPQQQYQCNNYQLELDQRPQKQSFASTQIPLLQNSKVNIPLITNQQPYYKPDLQYQGLNNVIRNVNMPNSQHQEKTYTIPIIK